MDSCILGLCQRYHVEILANGTTTVAGARDKLYPPRRTIPSLSSEGPSLASSTGASSVGRFPTTKMLYRQLDLPRGEFTFHKSLRRAIRTAQTLSKAHREFQQLLERVFVQ